MRKSKVSEKEEVKKGPWTPEEDEKLLDYIQKHGPGKWRTLPNHAGLKRCGKSCRLRWTNYLRPDIKRGEFSPHEEDTIIHLHRVLGNKWSAIAAHLPGRTDNEIKNYWNTRIKKKLLRMGIDPVTHFPKINLLHLSSILNSSLFKSSDSHLNHVSKPLLDPPFNSPYLNPDILNHLAATLLSDLNYKSPNLTDVQTGLHPLQTDLYPRFVNQTQLINSHHTGFLNSTAVQLQDLGECTNGYYSAQTSLSNYQCMSHGSLTGTSSACISSGETCENFMAEWNLGSSEAAEAAAYVNGV